MSESQYIKAKSTSHAFEIAGNFPGNSIYSGGGSDIQLALKQELIQKKVIIDISEIADLRGVKSEGNSLLIGSMTTLDDLISTTAVNDSYPLLIAAARSIASPVIRVTATVGGNLLVANRCMFYNQSEFWRNAAGSCLRDRGDSCLATGGHSKCFSRNVSDLAPALIALGANAIIQNKKGINEIPVEELYAPDGINFHTNLNDDAILIGVRLNNSNLPWQFHKLRRRESIDFTSLTIAASIHRDDRIKICLNGVSMSPVAYSADLRGWSLEEAYKKIITSCRIVNNDLMPLKYRREMIKVYLKNIEDNLIKKIRS